MLIEIDELTPVLLRRISRVPKKSEVLATSHHDRSTTTVGTHMTIVTTGGRSPEMNDQTSDTTPDH